MEDDNVRQFSYMDIILMHDGNKVKRLLCRIGTSGLQKWKQNGKATQPCSKDRQRSMVTLLLCLAASTPDCTLSRI